MRASASPVLSACALHSLSVVRFRLAAGGRRPAASGQRLASGRGRIHPFTTVHRALNPAFEDDLPYVVTVIELEEGLHMVSRISDCAPGRLAVDLPVEIAFERVSDQFVLPIFRSAPEPGGGRT